MASQLAKTKYRVSPHVAIMVRFAMEGGRVLSSGISLGGRIVSLLLLLVVVVEWRSYCCRCCCFEWK